MKKILSLLCVVLLLLSAVGCADSGAPAPTVRVASLKGPTSMGLVKLMDDAKQGTSANQYEFTMAGTADEIVPRIVKGEIDIALVPCNLASVLYANTGGSVSVVGINTLGVLYVVEVGDSIQSIEDLKGTTLYSTGKGTTPEYALNYVLSRNGIDPAADLTIEYKSEATEVAAALSAGTVTAAMLPQPYVTAVMAQNPEVRVALSLTEEWDKVDADSTLITGVAIVRKEFAEANPELIDRFLAEYAASVEFVNENPAEASEWIAELGIVAKAALAAKAIPECNIVLITGDEMKGKVEGYLTTLFDQNPATVGGALPNDDFYYGTSAQ